MTNEAYDPARADALAQAVAKDHDAGTLDADDPLARVDPAEGDKIVSHLFGDDRGAVESQLQGFLGGASGSLVQRCCRCWRRSSCHGSLARWVAVVDAPRVVQAGSATSWAMCSAAVLAAARLELVAVAVVASATSWVSWAARPAVGPPSTICSVRSSGLVRRRRGSRRVTAAAARRASRMSATSSVAELLRTGDARPRCRSCA
ncbi:hypothetical protein BH23ACT10_BH23ACT10_18170 [soil metagenome]